MTASDIIRRLHEHRLWVNQLLLAAVGSLSSDQLHRRFEIGQGSVWRSLTHLMAADFVWMEALVGNEQPLLAGDRPDKLPGNQEGDSGVQSLSELTALWKAIEQRWRDYLSALQDDDLGQTVFKVSTSSGLGKRFGTTRSDNGDKWLSALDALQVINKLNSAPSGRGESAAEGELGSWVLLSASTVAAAVDTMENVARFRIWQVSLPNAETFDSRSRAGNVIDRHHNTAMLNASSVGHTGTINKISENSPYDANRSKRSRHDASWPADLEAAISSFADDVSWL